MGVCKSAQANRKGINQPTASIVEDATQPNEEKNEKNPAAVAFGPPWRIKRRDDITDKAGCPRSVI
jgi:hypothetical protein